MKRLITNIRIKKEQANNLLYSFKYGWELLPVILMIVNTLIYLEITIIMWDMVISETPITSFSIQERCPEWFLIIYDLSKHFFETSIISWIVLYSLSKRWKRLSKGSLWFLGAYILLNSFMLLNSYSNAVPEAYFYGALTLLFLSFFLFAIFVIKNW